MSEQKSSHKGHCRCGKVELTITRSPIMTAACHCTGCQRMTSSAFSMGALVPADAFAVTRGEPEIGGLHGDSNHYHCGHCKSWLFSRPTGFESIVIVKTVMFDDLRDLPPFMETWTSEKLPWASTPAAHSYAQFPPPADLPKLIQQFASR
ncbi:GFA family protein [Ewingella americana]|uniref:GFA family protein n=1 Tax=Ewingella americana TaxID=41202 RepID=UPI0012AD2C62|nr:GFA family protein [Ewingella americana]MRT03441.1 aldehyde-activating protein [Ewingella americana]